MPKSITSLTQCLQQIRTCKLCEPNLPLGAKPILQADIRAKLLIIGQAPGTKAHKTALPFNDPSGDRLRQWLGIDRTTFYDASKIALVPMGFCYPGRDQKGGDLPPRKECAPLWHQHILHLLPNIQLTLLVGAYAQKYYLGKHKKPTLTETVQAWNEYPFGILPLPHPSWRNTAWLKKNSWFEAELIPDLQKKMQTLLMCVK